MKAPLPEVPPPDVFSSTSLSGLSLLCTLKAASLLWYPTFQISGFSPWLGGTLRVAFGALGLLLVYALWRGSDLARVVWIGVLGFTFATLLWPRPASAPAHGWTLWTVLNALLNAAMLVYLNLPAVKAHFDRRRAVK